MKYQLWNQDEYGTGTILKTFTDHNEAILAAMSYVTSDNFGNSLSSSEQIKNIESYFVSINDFVYGGSRRGGKHVFYKAGSSDPKEVDKNTKIRIYIGSRFSNNNGSKKEEMIYLTDAKGNEITDLSNKLLAGKSLYFIVPLP